MSATDGGIDRFDLSCFIGFAVGRWFHIVELAVLIRANKIAIFSEGDCHPAPLVAGDLIKRFELESGGDLEFFGE